MCEGILLRIFLAFLYLYANVAGTLWLDPPRAVVRHGDSLSVNCSTNVTNLMLDWEKPQGHSKKIDDEKVTWTVDHLTEWGTKPFCYMTHTDYRQEKIEFNIIIYKTPERVSLATVGHSGPVIEGGQYELQCDIQSVAPVEFLTVSWFKGDTLVDTKTFNDTTKTPVNQSPTLQISPSRADDGAQYKCKAELNLGPDGPQPPPSVTSDPLTITVYYGPNVSCLSHVTLKEGEIFTPNCSAVGNPPPEMTWYKNEERVDFPKQMDRTNAGEYILTVISSSTVVNHSLQIEVMYPPVSILELQNKLVDFGYDDSLECSSDARPHPQYRWKYDPMPNVRTEDGDGVSLLFIDYPTGINTGTYTCTASNELGEISRSVSVDVKDSQNRVTIETVGHTGPMIEDRKYVLRCNIQCVTPVHQVKVSWYKGNEQVKNASADDTRTSDSNTWSHNLTVSHNRNKKETQYKCKAEVMKTRGGPLIYVGESELNITVHYKPVINETKLPSVVPVFRGYPETLVCEADGYPLPTISWSYKPNTKVEEGHLTIVEATNENVGQYTCTASNSVETTVRTVKVTMKETPDRASISTVGHTGPMIKGRQYELQCDIHKVAPVEFLTVNWYKGDTVVENITITDSSKSPGNVSARLQISPSRDDDGAQYRCEAELGWNIDGTRPPLKVSSQVLGITVRYGNRTMFWAVVGSFVGLALVMVLGYLLKKRTG